MRAFLASLAVALFIVAVTLPSALAEPDLVKAGVFLDDFVCVLDPRINNDTITSFRNGTYLEQIKQFLWCDLWGDG